MSKETNQVCSEEWKPILFQKVSKKKKNQLPNKNKNKKQIFSNSYSTDPFTFVFHNWKNILECKMNCHRERNKDQQCLYTEKNLFEFMYQI